MSLKRYGGKDKGFLLLPHPASKPSSLCSWVRGGTQIQGTNRLTRWLCAEERLRVISYIPLRLLTWQYAGTSSGRSGTKVPRQPLRTGYVCEKDCHSNIFATTPTQGVSSSTMILTTGAGASTSNSPVADRGTATTTA